MIPFSLYNTLIYTIHIVFFFYVYENKHILIHIILIHSSNAIYLRQNALLCGETYIIS